MAVREFTDSNNREWRAWSVTPDNLNARTKDEVYLANLYYTGWIVFETKAGNEKRRLYPIPKGWTELANPELEVLLNKAEVVPQRKLRSERLTGEAAARETERAADFARQAIDAPEKVRHVPSEETPDVTDLRVVRTFRYPTGRIWSACVVEHSSDGSGPVLQFAAGARHINLRDWPKDWADYPDEGLVNLLRRAIPRPTSALPGADTPKRRWDDTATS